MKDIGRNVFIVIGKQGAGKSTFGRFFAKARGTEFHETSEWLVQCETLRQKALNVRYGLTSEMVELQEGMSDSCYGILKYPFTRLGWDPDRNRPARELLVALGDAVNTIDPTFLPDMCYAKGDVATGTRRVSEFDALLAKYGDRLNVIYITGRQGAQTEIDNFEISLEYAKSKTERVFHIENDGSMEQLESRAKELAEYVSELEQQG